MTKLDMERIATLAHHPGYLALLKLLDENDCLLLEKLEKEDNPERSGFLLGRWRANRSFRRLITGQPEALYEELGGSINLF